MKPRGGIKTKEYDMISLIADINNLPTYLAIANETCNHSKVEL